MHRRPNGLAEERKLLKQINSSRNNADDDLDPCLPEDGIRGRLQYLLDIYQILTGRTWHSKEHIERMGLGSMDVKVVMKEMKELEWVLEKGFANAPPKGKTWNSLPSKQELKDQIKVMEQDSDCRRKKHLQLRAEIKQAKAKVKAIEKEISSLQRKLNEL